MNQLKEISIFFTVSEENMQRLEEAVLLLKQLTIYSKKSYMV